MSEEKKHEKKSVPHGAEDEIAVSKKRKTDLDIEAASDVEHNTLPIERELQELETEFGQSRYQKDFYLNLSSNPSQIRKAAAKQLVANHSDTHIATVVKQGALWIAKFIEKRPCAHCHGTSNC